MHRADAEWLELNGNVIAEHRETAGRLTGHFEGNPTLLLTTLGARSKLERTSPLTFTRDGENYVVAASKAGAPTHPAWLHNLRANPIVKVELGAETFMTASRVAEEPERSRLWAAHVEQLPRFADYELATDRMIPMVVLAAIATAI